MPESRSPDKGGANVVLDVDYRGGAFELVLSNIGSDVAHDIRVEFSRKLVGAGGTVVSALPLFQQLQTLRPGKEIRVFLDSASDLLRRRRTNSFGATVVWRDSASSDHKARYRHSLDAYRGLPEIVAREQK
jgi:hypothetical protein